MAKKAYIGNSNGKARQIKKGCVGVNGVARELDKGYIGVNGVARQCWERGIPLGELAVGDTVYMNVDGVSTEFIIVQQGKPSALYDGSCDGTWLLMKDIYTKSTWRGDNLGYELSKPHTYLNDTFVSLLDEGVQGLIKQVKIPYCTRSGNDIVVRNGANGLSTKAFLLSRREVDATVSTPADGAILEYFKGASNADRDATYNASKTSWWLRSRSYNYIYYVGNDGKTYNGENVSQGIRPALILPFEALVDSEFTIITD